MQMPEAESESESETEAFCVQIH